MKYKGKILQTQLDNYTMHVDYAYNKYCDRKIYAINNSMTV